MNPSGSNNPAGYQHSEYTTDAHSRRRLSVPSSSRAARPSHSTSRYWNDVLSPDPTPVSSAHLPSSSTSATTTHSITPSHTLLPPPHEFASLPVLSLPISHQNNHHHHSHHHQHSSVPHHHHHHPSSRSIRRPTATRQFHCSLCPSRFERRGHLEAHVETVHEGKRPHRCPRGCGKVFGHRSSLHRHIKTVHENPLHRDSDKHSSRKKQLP